MIRLIRCAVVLASITIHFHLFHGASTRAAEFTLNLVTLDAQRRPTLSLSGLTTGRYGLEASTNLSQWFNLTSASAANGPLTFLHTEAPQLGTVYYRGRQLLDVSPIVPQVDSNQVASTLITMAAGGTVSLTNDAGVRYTFTVGPSNVNEAVAITMQLITNFTSFPFENEMRTAVIFEPSGFQFHGAGFLEITFPTNVPHLKLSSFSFASNGLGFHLTPDLIATNRVRIPVSHFSGVGTGLWAPSERTKAVTSFVENTRDRQAHEIAGILGQDRDSQLLGSEPGDIWLEIERRQNDYYNNNLKPFFTEAETDCALSRFLTQEILAIERQSQILGLTNAPSSSFLGSATSKKWNCNCLQEALDACEDGTISDKTLLQTLLGAERQSQLLGGGSALESCGLGSLDAILDKAVTEKLPCAPAWIGIVSYTDGGSRTWDCSGGTPGVTCTTTANASLNFEADVETVALEDESFPPFFTKQTWTLKFFPQANGNFSKNSHSVHPTACGATTTTTHRITGAATGPLDLEVVFTFEDGELVDFNIGTITHGALEVKTIDLARGVTSPCPSGGTGSSTANTFQGTLFMDPESINIDEVLFTKRTTTALEGTVTATRSGLDAITMPFTYKFSLRRNGP